MIILSRAKATCPEEKVFGEVNVKVFDELIPRALYWAVSDEIRQAPLQLAEFSRPGLSLMGTIMRTVSFTKDVKL